MPPLAISAWQFAFGRQLAFVSPQQTQVGNFYGVACWPLLSVQC